jgi:hypothetical protein
MKIKQYAACVAAVFAIGAPGVAFAEDAPPTTLIDPEAEAAAAETNMVALVDALAAETEAADPDVNMVAIVDALVAEADTQLAVNELSDDDLGDQRGGQALVVGTQTLSAISSGSILNGNYNAGAVNISDNALSNFNGIGNVVINTGAQNTLQSGMNLVINIIN